PLREPKSRLKQVDYILSDNVKIIEGFTIQWEQQGVYRLQDTSEQLLLSHFKGMKVHAVTGIACPNRFFRMLQSHGLLPLEHSFPDHHFFQSKDLYFQDNAPILITEKDAVKCRGLKIRSPIWVVRLEVTLEEAFISRILEDVENGQKVA
ncbi:MAG TPA: tetraacyldisaccharide 4'-kinase, partial [Gammaproteobacteria bacterium]|nr:tetraacyldisaccharide 4'-kinase [Gammaproteobacteria bacterium]